MAEHPSNFSVWSHKTITMTEGNDGAEMQVRNLRSVPTDESNASLDTADISPAGEIEDQKHQSAAVRRLLSDDSFHAPKQEGTVRIEV